MVVEANGRTTQYIVGQRVSSREKKKSEKFGKSLSGYPALARLIGRAHLMAARKPLLRWSKGVRWLDC
jgi:hypothetical protein